MLTFYMHLSVIYHLLITINCLSSTQSITQGQTTTIKELKIIISTIESAGVGIRIVLILKQK